MTYYSAVFADVTAGSDTINLSWLGAPSGGTIGHSVDAWNGGDIVYGS